jgi:serine/threonine protein kinase
MNSLYRAQDTKLERAVALKILPVHVAVHQDRMRRFVQEAKTASALNHPNIITIYEIEQIDSVNFIATEFIDGETHTDIESLSMKGNIATVVIHQHYVRVIRGGDASPHEVRTTVRHRETWIYTERGWLQKSVQELEGGTIFMDGQPFIP